MTIRITLFGPFEARRDDVCVRLPARKTEALLAVLALRPGLAHSRESLAALLWPDVPEAQGRTSLRQAIGHLRRAFSDALLVSSGDQVHLDPGAAWVDAPELERALARAPAEREPVLQLFRGALLDGFPAIEDAFEEWLVSQRARVAERVESRMEECVAALSAAGELERAIRVATWLVELDPVRETAHRALMRLHAERGERSLGLLQYERCRELLERRLGVAPSDETESVRRALLERPSASAGAIEPPPRSSTLSEREGRLTLAVLSFEAASEGAVSRLLAEGLTEDVTTELSRFHQLAVVSRASVARFAPSARAEDVARETSARLVLSGSVRVAAGRARVTAALIDATTALQLWAERWELAHEDAFGVLDRLTRSVVGALALRIDEARLERARKRPRERLEVYECWLRGLECLRRGTPEGDEEARGLFEQAIALAPDFARAYAGISLSHFNDWSCQAWDRWDERERLAFENARRAVELDDGDPVTQYILGRIYIYRREFERGERHLEHALASNPNDVDVLMHAAIGYAQLGQPERSRELADTALSLNPKRPDWYYVAAALPRFWARELDASVRLFLRAPDGHVDTRAYLAAALALAGDRDGARLHAERFLLHFREKISRRAEADAAEAVRWLLHVNPIQRKADADYLLDGLRGAGLL